MVEARLTPSRNEAFTQPGFNLTSDPNVIPAIAPSITGITLMTRQKIKEDGIFRAGRKFGEASKWASLA